MGVACKYKVYVERLGKSSDIIKLFDNYDDAVQYAKHQPIGYSYIYKCIGFEQKLMFTKANRKVR